MATAKQPGADPQRRVSPNLIPDVDADLDLPEVDLEAPLYDREAREADKARRRAAVEAFHNEKAHERPPGHRA